MKKCANCQQEKPSSSFNKKSNSRNGLQPYCKECDRQKSREYYKKNAEKHRKIVNERRRTNINYLQSKVIQYLLEHPCVDCGETDPLVLQFDHIKDKEIEICRAINNNWSWPRLKKEIDKCEVRCANCHSRKTAKQNNHYYLRLVGIQVDPATAAIE